MEDWLSSHEAAEYLHYSYYYFMREIKTDPDFPKPYRRATARGLGHAQYKRADLDRWRNSLLQAA